MGHFGREWGHITTPQGFCHPTPFLVVPKVDSREDKHVDSLTPNNTPREGIQGMLPLKKSKTLLHKQNQRIHQGTISTSFRLCGLAWSYLLAWF